MQTHELKTAQSFRKHISTITQIFTDRFLQTHKKF